MKDLIKKEKHEHKLTNILKFVIFAIVMLAPFIAILSKIVYVSANKNAKNSYYGETINEKRLIQTNYDNLIIGEIYEISAINIGTQSTEMGGSTYKLAITNAKFINYTPQIDMNNINGLTFYSTTSGTTYINLMNQNTQILSINSGQNYILQYQLQSKNLLGTSITLFNMLNNNYVEYNKNSYLDNVFYYALDQSKESELLKWTKNTPIYNAINSMNTGLGLSSNHILTYLLTYWSIMIAIYIIFDIIIFALTKLTHWLN